MIGRKLVLFSLLLYIQSMSFAQDVHVNTSARKVALNQYFTITIEVKNDQIRDHSEFPRIPGFIKRGTSTSSFSSIANGRISSSVSVTQNYQPTNVGTFNVSTFEMTINGKKVKTTGFSIQVGKTVQNQTSNNPFNNFFNSQAQTSKEFIDVKADAFLAFSPNKREVYVGEGFSCNLSLYVSAQNRAEMRYYELVDQLSKIIKKLKPENCWEEQYELKNIETEIVEINGKQYRKNKLYQTHFFPLNADDIRFPSVELKVVKFNVAKKPVFFGNNVQEVLKSFYSKSITVKVKELPPHPLKTQVAVGNFQLKENLSKKKIATGNSLNYSFSIFGIGNMNAVNPPDPAIDSNFDFYPPNVDQNINQSNNIVSGTKTFNYHIIPNEPGTYDLGKYFKWIFFNTRKDGYDTLRSSKRISVTGNSRKNEFISANDMGSFYDKINGLSNEIKEMDAPKAYEWIFNALIILLALGSLYIVFRKIK